MSVNVEHSSVAPASSRKPKSQSSIKFDQIVPLMTAVTPYSTSQKPKPLGTDAEANYSLDTSRRARDAAFRREQISVCFNHQRCVSAKPARFCIFKILNPCLYTKDNARLHTFRRIGIKGAFYEKKSEKGIDFRLFASCCKYLVS